MTCLNIIFLYNNKKWDTKKKTHRIALTEIVRGNKVGIKT